MSAKFFVLYGNNIITPHVIEDEAELFAWARRDDAQFNWENYGTMREAIEAADKLLLARYKVWGLFEYTPEGMAEFLEAAAKAGDLVALHAIELANEFVEDAQKKIAAAFGAAQQKAVSVLPFPVAGDSAGFQKYMENVRDVRDLSVKGMIEFIENDHKFPD